MAGGLNDEDRIYVGNEDAICSIRLVRMEVGLSNVVVSWGTIMGAGW